MDSERIRVLELIKNNLNLNSHEFKEITENFDAYDAEIADLAREIEEYKKIALEMGKLSSLSARLNYETYETYMAVHTNTIKISGEKAVIKISGQELSKEVKSEIDDLMEKYLMIRF